MSAPPLEEGLVKRLAVTLFLFPVGMYLAGAQINV